MTLKELKQLVDSLVNDLGDSEVFVNVPDVQHNGRESYRVDDLGVRSESKGQIILLQGEI